MIVSPTLRARRLVRRLFAAFLETLGFLRRLPAICLRLFRAIADLPRVGIRQHKTNIRTLEARAAPFARAHFPICALDRGLS